MINNLKIKKMKRTLKNNHKNNQLVKRRKTTTTATATIISKKDRVNTQPKKYKTD